MRHSDEVCENCQFYKRLSHRRDGECRKYPPRNNTCSKFDEVPDNYLITMTEFPEVKSDCWCGEFKSVVEEDRDDSGKVISFT